MSPMIKDELIGKQVIIISCTDPSWIQKKGTIIDETKNTFLIQIENKQKRIAKETATFAIYGPEKKTIIDGKRLKYRPEDRIKKAR